MKLNLGRLINTPFATFLPDNYIPRCFSSNGRPADVHPIKTRRLCCAETRQLGSRWTTVEQDQR